MLELCRHITMTKRTASPVPRDFSPPPQAAQCVACVQRASTLAIKQLIVEPTTRQAIAPEFARLPVHRAPPVLHLTLAFPAQLVSFPPTDRVATCALQARTRRGLERKLARAAPLAPTMTTRRCLLRLTILSRIAKIVRLGRFYLIKELLRLPTCHRACA